ncbi:MAG TPA: lipopolysaccharide biosynthesis protein, partial [Bacteroidales bacterium]|nr:lipopolysaccharide biosynthesis protein [Bacteroidales bacterium]
MIRRHIRRLRENHFLVHVLTLVSGAALAQAILFAFTPLLTRLFDPSDFGVFALYTAIVSTLGVVAAWKYELAIMLPAEEKEARTLVWLSVAATLVTTGVVLLLTLVLRPWLGQWVGPDILPILFILPLGVFFNAFFQILLTYASRHKEFSRVSVSRVVQAGSAVGLQSGIAWSSLFPLGLVWGKLGADILASLSLLWSFLRTGRLPGPRVSLAEMKEAGRKHYQFPRFQSLAAFMNSLSQNLPAILLTFYYDPAVAGLYALTARVLSAPTQLIGKSTREVFYQRASERYASGQPILGLFRRTIGGLAKVGALPFLILMFITPWLFGWL